MSDTAIRPAFIEPKQWALLDYDERQFWEQFARDLEWLAEQPQFRRAAFTLFDGIFGANSTTFDVDPYRAAHKQGMRDAGLHLQTLIQAVAPKMWMRTLNEHFNERKRSLFALPKEPDDE